MNNEIRFLLQKPSIFDGDDWPVFSQEDTEKIMLRYIANAAATYLKSKGVKPVEIQNEIDEIYLTKSEKIQERYEQALLLNIEMADELKKLYLSQEFKKFDK